jgi:hypothetical protein
MDGSSPGFWRDRLSLLLLLAGLLGWIPSVSFAAELQANTDLATAGYYQLQWHDGDQHVRFQLQEADNPQFEQARQLYQGPDRARVITGRPDGEYYYRLRVLGVNGSTGDWSAPVRVEVQHHSLSRAFAFFGVGAVVFLAILIAIVVGNRYYHSKESQ